MRKNGVRCLVMGGQACVLYGGAEFSRDIDLVLVADAGNLASLQRALNDLQAETIAVPPFEAAYLDRGHEVHFRCRHPEANLIRVDVMSHLRGVEPFPNLWSRRSTFDLDGESIEVLGLPDLVCAKKTQRDKDWIMISRLLESHYATELPTATPGQIAFWLREHRAPELLIDCVERFPVEAQTLSPQRPAIGAALRGRFDVLVEELSAEERAERTADIAYWKPLKAELENLRRLRGSQ